MSQLTLTVVAYTEKHSEVNFVRSQVYEIEQGINPDRVFDGKDELADHILAYLDNQPVGTARIRCLSSRSQVLRNWQSCLPRGGKALVRKLWKSL
jgi:hypothetical protein